MASIKERKDKDGKVIGYHVQIRMKGHRPEHGSFKTKTEMKKWIQDTESAIREGRHFKTTEAKKHTLGDLIDRYIRDVLPTKKKSEQKQTAQLNWWKEQIGYYLLSEITPSIIAEQRDKLLREITQRKKPRNPSTVVRYLAALSHAFTIAIKEWEWIQDSPVSKVTKPKEARGRVRFLDSDERSRLLSICKESQNPYLHIIVVLALSTGMWQAEILNLKWPDVDLDKGRVILHETKNGEIRQVTIAGLALHLLKELDKVRRIDTQLLFPGKYPKKPIVIRSAWEKAVKMAGIKDFVFHSLRHSCASYLAMDGARIQVVTSCVILTEGYDEPSVNAVIMARPTKSSGLFTQCIGKGLRLWPGKENCLVLDFTDRHHTLDGIMSLSNTLPETVHIEEQEHENNIYEEVDRSPKIEVLHECDHIFDILGSTRFIWVQVGDEWSLQDDDRNEIVMHPSGSGYIAVIYSTDGSSSQIVNQPLPLEYCSGVCEDYARRYLKISFADMKAPWMSTDSQPTKGQRDYLEKKGGYAEGMTRGQASIEIRKIITSKNKQKRLMASEAITDKQRYFLKGYDIDTSSMSKFQAMREIAKLKQRVS